MKKHTGRNNLGKEKAVMIASSVLILGALTVTGIYVRKEDQKAEDNGYSIDLESLEQSAEEIPEEELIIVGDDDLDVDPDALEADSGSVDNGLKVSDQDEKEKQLGKKTMTAMDISEYEPSLKDDAPSVVEAEALPEDMTKADAEEETSEAISMGFQPELNFNEDSTLVMPLVGDILLNYSADKSIYFPTLKQYKVNPAVMIATAEGTSASAGADGLVKRIYDSPVTGKTIVMDLGNGYELTYGQLKDVFVSEGSYVKTGDILGEVGSPTRYFSVEGTHLYMKLTKEGVPQNPLG